MWGQEGVLSLSGNAEAGLLTTPWWRARNVRLYDLGVPALQDLNNGTSSSLIVIIVVIITLRIIVIRLLIVIPI